MFVSISAADSPDFLSEELDMLKNMKMAIYEERYKDAGIYPNILFFIMFLQMSVFIYKLMFVSFSLVEG